MTLRYPKRAKPSETDPLWILTVKITRFMNVAFGRRLRPSRAMYDAIVSATEAGYTEEEIRIAYWTARCIAGDVWLKEALSKDLSPEIVLRHHGGINPKTGQPAKRWLDDMISRVGETNRVLIAQVYKKLPDDMKEEERKLLEEMNVAWDDSARRNDGKARPQ